MIFSKFQKITIIGIGTLTVTTLVCYNMKNKFPFYSGKSEILNNSTFSKWDYNWDRRDPKSILKFSNNIDDLKSNTKNAMKISHHIILIRHGQYNIQGKADDERYLTNLGKLQAEVTGMRLAEIGFPYKAIVASTMKRAQETSQFIQKYLPGVPVINECLLVEGFPVSPDPPTGHWKPEKAFFQDGPRIEAAFRKYIHRAEITDDNDVYTIIVCHANVIRYFVCRALQIPSDAWLRMSLNHGSITWITVLSSGRVILRCFGETGFMMPQWITST